jgi:hypothetical protein
MILEENPNITSKQIDKKILYLLGNKKTNKLFEKVTDINEDFIYKRPNST